MAVDTAAKRFKMLNFGEGDQVLPPPDGTIGTDDLYHLLGLYNPITAAGRIARLLLMGVGH